MADLPVPIGSFPISFGPVLGELAYALIGFNARFIDTIIPDVTVEEVHHDELAITDHPVEIGAAISDHAFHLPYELQMRIGFSNSTAQAEGYVQLVYQQFQALQLRREPFSVSTGKRLYNNMLIRSMQVTTDVSSEFALNMVVQLREIILTYTQQADSTSGANSDPNNKAQTSPPQEQGEKNPKPADPLSGLQRTEGAQAAGEGAGTPAAGALPPISPEVETGFGGGASPQAPAAVDPPSGIDLSTSRYGVEGPPVADPSAGTPWGANANTPATVPSPEPTTGFTEIPGTGFATVK